jgi:multidrug efflux pump subunit AcrA (membrane-fusion protein)
VFLVAKSNTGETAKLRRVEVGEVEGSDINITTGLMPGDIVITTGATLIKDGDRVEVIK